MWAESFEAGFRSHTHLYNSWVTRQPMLRLRWFRHRDVFNVTPSEDDVFVDFFFWWNGSVCVPILRPVGFNCRRGRVTQ